MGLWVVGIKAQVHDPVIVNLQDVRLRVGRGDQMERGTQKIQSYWSEVNRPEQKRKPRLRPRQHKKCNNTFKRCKRNNSPLRKEG
jgi:hypothetical protein